MIEIVRRSGDAAERETALDTSRSFLVQAPAGSGKTELLTRRFLKLLGEVDQPEQIVAITFTRAATAEMRDRILDALHKASRGEQAEPDGPVAALAREAVAQDARREWRLLEQPQRLNIGTIDSLSLSITRRTPLLSRLGGNVSPTEHAKPLYHRAARRTLSELGGDRLDLSSAIRELLAVRDSDLKNCEDLIANMLGRRDQWRSILPFAAAAATDDDAFWLHLKQVLEEPFVRIRKNLTKRTRDLLTREAAVWDELVSLIHHACGNLEHFHPDAALLRLENLDPLDWLTDEDGRMALCGFLLKGKGGFRKALKESDGFPSGKSGQQAKQRFAAMIDSLAQREEACELLQAFRDMPPAQYSPEQWHLLRQVLLVLRHAVAELRVLFSEERTVDFIEVGMAARQALRGDNDHGPGDHEDKDDSGPVYRHPWKHLLVDEYQDTSLAQFELFDLLVRQWEQDDERHSCFLVGDPMQSIYSFRSAEVELFDLTRRNGLAGFPLEMLTLQSNFRSHSGIVEPLNRIFSSTFSGSSASGKVPYSPSEAVEAAPEGGPWVFMDAILGLPDQEPISQQEIRLAEADKAVAIIQRALEAEPDPAKLRIGVLGRKKNDLRTIAQQLRKAKIPFRAVEMEALTERQEILDIRALTRALLHPMDRIAWLSVLRAPWCGLSLNDLHALCGANESGTEAGLGAGREPVLHLLRSRQALLTPDGVLRTARITPVLEDGIRGLAHQPVLARWIERVWTALGGPAAATEEQQENIRAFLAAIEDLPPTGAGLDESIDQLFAVTNPAASASASVELMTIHKAKGLRFDLVLVPALDSKPRNDDSPLLAWLERAAPDGDAGARELLVCPIGEKGGDKERLYTWIGRLAGEKRAGEAKRLLYVAATRASRELHLMGSIKMKHGSLSAPPLSLLGICRSGLELEFRSEWIAGQSVANSGGSGNDLPFAAELEPSLSSTLPLRRLPPSWAPPWGEEDAGEPHIGKGPMPAEDAIPLVRPQGALESRAVGTALHALLEELSLDLVQQPIDSVRSRVPFWQPRAIALLRSQGLSSELAARASNSVVSALQSALADRTGCWILGPHPSAESEIPWSQWSARELKTLRGDRTFRAGAEPLSSGETHQWIIDYKTATHADAGLEVFLKSEEERYRPQLARYGDALRRRGNRLPLRLGLYYPILGKLIWWEA